jgi:hypothetical protein
MEQEVASAKYDMNLESFRAHEEAVRFQLEDELSKCLREEVSLDQLLTQTTYKTAELSKLTQQREQIIQSLRDKKSQYYQQRVDLEQLEGQINHLRDELEAARSVRAADIETGQLTFPSLYYAHCVQYF